MLLKLKLISVFIESEVSLRDVGNSDDFLRDGDFKKFLDFIVVCVLLESMVCEYLWEDFFEGEKVGFVEINVV